MKRKKTSKLDLFQYLNYRQFLKDYYQQAKESKTGFSFRSFSKKAGFGSPNFLKRVMDGDRNLTPESTEQMALGLELNKQETEFFNRLVLYNQADTHDEKDYHYTRLLRSQKLKKLKPMERDQYEYYSTWYHPVVRELIVTDQFNGDLEKLSEKIFPRVTLDQVEKSIELLERLQFIRKNKKGQWEQSDSLVTAGARVSSTILYNYHANVLDLAKHQLFKGDHNKRDISVLTLGVLKERLPQLKAKIQEFRKEVLEMVSDDDNPEEVVLLAMQLMPVTQ